jgi:glycosyltransferase involved in cell wall biosynthesis
MRAVLVDLLCNSPFYCAELARALSQAGVRTELASPLFYLEPEALESYPRSRWIADLAVHASRPRPLRLAARAVEGLLNYVRLLRRIDAKEYDVVHVEWIPFSDKASPFMSILRTRCDRSGTLLVVSAHNAVPHDRPRTDLRVLKGNLDRAQLIIAHSAHVALELAQEVGTVAPITVVPLGPQFADRALPPRDVAARRLGDPTEPIILFLGLIRPYKGVDLLSDAWPDVRASFPDATLIVVGKALDPGAALDLQALGRQEGVRVVDRYVSVASMLDYYAVADVVVLPYRRISQSAAFMTAVSLGRPTVVTPIAGLQEQARGLRSAVVAEEVTAAGIARALTASLRTRDEMAEAAERDRAALADSPLGWASVARATVAAYETHIRVRSSRD